MPMDQPDYIEPLKEPLEAVQRLLSRFDDRGVVIGGTAVSILGRPRLTEDVDAMFLLSIQDIPRLLDAAKKEGIAPRINNVEEFAGKNRVVLLRHIPSDTSIDISLGIMPFEEEMVERSTLYELDDSLKVRLPSPEDLVIMKSIPRRPKDLEDIRSIAQKYPDLDKKRIKKWVSAFGEILDQPDLWKQIEALLTSA